MGRAGSEAHSKAHPQAMSAETVTAYWTAIGLGLVMAASFLLGRSRGLGWLSPPLIALALTAFLVNVGWMPGSENNPVYGFVTGPGLLVAIFLLLLQVDLGVFQRAGLRMVMLFFAGGAAILVGIAATLFIPWIGATLGAEYPTLSGMYAATYIGGSVNFNATAAVFGLERQSDTFAIAVTADNTMGSLWIALSVLFAPFLQRILPTSAWCDPADFSAPTAAEPADYAIALAASCAAVLSALWLNMQFPMVHPILWLSGIALIAAQTSLRAVSLRLEPVAVLFLYLFIAAIGAEISITALAKSGNTLLACIALIACALIVHGLVIVIMGRLTKTDSDTMIVASQACIGGPPTVLAVAHAIGRKDLRIPGAAIGLIGYAVGTYVGVGMNSFVAMLVR